MSRSSADDSWLREALAGADVAAWNWEVVPDRITLSESWPEILGEPRRAVTTSARELSDLVHPDDLPRVMTVLNDALRGQTPVYDMEHRVRTASGAYRWIQSRGKVVERRPDGRATRLTGTNADITARHRAEEMLAARETQLRVVIDSVPAMIMELDPDDRIRYCNRPYAQFF